MPNFIDQYLPGAQTQQPAQPQAPAQWQSPWKNPYTPNQDPRLTGLDQATIAAALGGAGDEMELDAMEKQMARAQALRDQAGPEGRSSGRVYVAANPLEHLGHGLQQYAAAKQMRELEEGVRNPGYAPGVTTTPQPEFKKEGMAQIRKRRGETIRKVGEGYFKGK